RIGLTVLRLIVGHLLPIGAPLLVAVDDTMFRRCGRRVHAAHWGYDGSLKVDKANQKCRGATRSWSPRPRPPSRSSSPVTAGPLTLQCTISGVCDAACSVPVQS